MDSHLTLLLLGMPASQHLESGPVDPEHIIAAHVDRVVVHQPADAMRIGGIARKVTLSGSMRRQRHLDTEIGTEGMGR
jgi:hypothetical protein